MDSPKTVSFSRFTEIHRYSWIRPVGGFYEGLPQHKKKVTFSRFQEIYRYDWVAPVGGFQTKLN